MDEHDPEWQSHTDMAPAWLPIGFLAVGVILGIIIGKIA